MFLSIFLSTKPQDHWLRQRTSCKRKVRNLKIENTKVAGATGNLGILQHRKKHQGGWSHWKPWYFATYPPTPSEAGWRARPNLKSPAIYPPTPEPCPRAPVHCFLGTQCAPQHPQNVGRSTASPRAQIPCFSRDPVAIVSKLLQDHDNFYANSRLYFPPAF